MARIGNFDVTLNRQGWFDINAADPRNGQFDKVAIGVEGAIELQPPGIPSASQVASGFVIQIVSAAGIPSASVQGAPFVAVIVEPPGIASASIVGPAENAIVIRPVGISSAEVVAPADVSESLRLPGIPSASEVAPSEVSGALEPPGIPTPSEVAAGEIAAGISPPGIPSASEVSSGETAQNASPPGIPSAEVVAPADVGQRVQPPGIPSAESVAAGDVAPEPPRSTAAHGGWPATTRAHDRPPWTVDLQLDAWWQLWDEAPRPNFWGAPENDNADSVGSVGIFDWAASIDPNDPLTHDAGIIRRLGPLVALPQQDYMVAGEITSESRWKWIAIGAAVGLGAAFLLRSSPASSAVALPSSAKPRSRRRAKSSRSR